MLKFLKRISIYIKVYPDKIAITNIQTDQTIFKSALTKFSSVRLVVAEFNIAETLIRQILKDMGLSKRTLKILIQQIHDFEGELCESEKRILRDLGEQAGGAIVHIVNQKKGMSKDEINNFLQLH